MTRSAAPGAGDAAPFAAEQRRLLAAIPGHAAVREERDRDGDWTVHRLRDAERAKQRESELEVGDHQAASSEPLLWWTLFRPEYCAEAEEPKSVRQKVLTERTQAARLFYMAIHLNGKCA